MDFNELMTILGVGNASIRVTIINPIRKETETYKYGTMMGFKPGLWGGGHKNYKNGIPTSFCSLDQHWLKKPKVFIAYDVFTFGEKTHSDWIDVDNCEFEIVKK